MEFTWAEFSACCNLPLNMLFVKRFGSCYLKLATGCVGSGLLGRDSVISQRQMLSMSGTQQPVWSYGRSIVCGCLCWAWLRRGRTSTGPMGGLANLSRHPRISFNLPLLGGCLSGLVTEKAQSLKEPLAHGAIGSPMNGRWLQTSGKMVWSPSPEPHIWVPDFSMASPSQSP